MVIWFSKSMPGDSNVSGSFKNFQVLVESDGDDFSKAIVGHKEYES